MKKEKKSGISKVIAYLVFAAIFLLSAVVDFKEGNAKLGIVFSVLTVAYIGLAAAFYKRVKNGENDTDYFI